MIWDKVKLWRQSRISQYFTISIWNEKPLRSKHKHTHTLLSTFFSRWNNGQTMTYVAYPRRLALRSFLIAFTSFTRLWIQLTNTHARARHSVHELQLGRCVNTTASNGRRYMFVVAGAFEVFSSEQQKMVTDSLWFTEVQNGFFVWCFHVRISHEDGDAAATTNKTKQIAKWMKTFVYETLYFCWSHKITSIYDYYYL